MTRFAALLLPSAIFFTTAFLPAQTTSHGAIERVKVHGKSLEGNLEGDSPDRDVSVYLPPSYQTATTRRYPVVYLLHGYTDDDAKWFGLEKHWIHLPAVLDSALAKPGNREVIVVMPNAYTRFAGSMYSSSVTTGDWETFVVSELVSYVDSHYRTIPQTASRGLAGHSMGGYGAMRIGMKYPNVFAGIYLLSPCCLSPMTAIDPQVMGKIEAVRTMDDFNHAGFFTKVLFASAAAWSPNPTKLPFYIDLPLGTPEAQRQVLDRWTANAPLTMLDSYVFQLRTFKGIGFDAGTRDQPIASTIQVLDQRLTAYGIPHEFEIYEGDHLNRVGERIETKLLPFFTKVLSFDMASAGSSPVSK